MEICGVADNCLQGGRGLKFDVQDFNVKLGDLTGGLRSPFVFSSPPMLRARLVLAVELQIVTPVGFGASCKHVFFRRFCVKLEIGHVFFA